MVVFIRECSLIVMLSILCAGSESTIIVERDCAPFSSSLQSTKTYLSSHGDLVEDIKWVTIALRDVYLSFVNPLCNHVVHVLEKKALIKCISHIWVENCPS